MTTLPQGTPYYGGGQVPNPANVIKHTGVPSSVLTEDNLGTLSVDNANATVYALASKSGGVDTWISLGGGTSAVAQLTGDTGTATPSGGSIKIAGTANQITTTGSGAQISLTLPAAITAPGSLSTTTTLASGTTLAAGTSLTAGTTITATAGNITATNGNVVMSTAGNKLVVPATTTTTGGAFAAGSVALVGGAATVNTSAVTANSLIFVELQALGTIPAPAAVGVTARTANTSFTITSNAGTDTSTYAWIIIN